MRKRLLLVAVLLLLAAEVVVNIWLDHQRPETSGLLSQLTGTFSRLRPRQCIELRNRHPEYSMALNPAFSETERCELIQKHGKQRLTVELVESEEALLWDNRWQPEREYDAEKGLMWSSVVIPAASGPTLYLYPHDPHYQALGEDRFAALSRTVSYKLLQSVRENVQEYTQQTRHEVPREEIEAYANVTPLILVTERRLMPRLVKAVYAGEPTTGCSGSPACGCTGCGPDATMCGPNQCYQNCCRDCYAVYEGSCSDVSQCGGSSDCGGKECAWHSQAGTYRCKYWRWSNPYWGCCSSGGGSPCIPDCSCTSSTCCGQTCSDGCGGSCDGTKDCINAYVDPNPVGPSGKITFTFTSNVSYTYVEFDGKAGVSWCNLKNASCSGNPMGDGNKCWWRWECTAVSGGTYTAVFNNRQGCKEQIDYTVTCPPAWLYVVPNPVGRNSSMVFSSTSDFAFVNIGVNTGGGATCNWGEVSCSQSPIPAGSKKRYCWNWYCTSSGTAGHYTGAFTGHVSEASSVPCSYPRDYTVGAPTSTPTPTPTPTSTPTPTPTCAPPAAPRCVSPNNTIVNETSVNLVWQGITNWGNWCGDDAGARQYRIHFGPFPSLPPFLVAVPGTQTSYLKTGLEYGQSYVWGVKAKNLYTISDFGNVCSFSVRETQPWWQAKDGDVHFQDDLFVHVPKGNFLILDGDNGGQPGVASALYPYGDIDVSPGRVSSQDWQAKTNYATNKTFEYLKNRLNIDTRSPLKSFADNEIPVSPGTEVYYLEPPSGTLEVRGRTIDSEEKIIVFVRGHVKLDYPNLVVEPGGFFALVANGHITIDSGITQAQGLFLADGQIRIPSSGSVDSPFEGQGSFIALEGVSLRRNLGRAGNADPAEMFSSRFDLLLNAPAEFRYARFVFKELPP